MIVKSSSPTSHLVLERKKIDNFFQDSLERLSLTKSQILKQSQKELENSLSTVEDAIRNPNAFGSLKVTMTAVGAVIVVKSKSEHLFEVGVLPLLLESKTLILTRLAEFGGDLVQTERELHERKVLELQKVINASDTRWRVWTGILLGIISILLIFMGPEALDWSWWQNHQKPIPLHLITQIAVLGIIWSLLESSESRRWIAISSVVFAAIIAFITII